MLRPALLLPPKRLLTPRFDRTPLGAGRWPATRRSGAYLGGTLTRWLGPAFRTRHGRILAGAIDAAEARVEHPIGPVGSRTWP